MGLRISEQYSGKRKSLKDYIDIILGRPTNREVVTVKIENILGQTNTFIETIEDPLIKDLMRVKYQIAVSTMEQLASELDIVNRFMEEDTATILARKIRKTLDDMNRE